MLKAKTAILVLLLVAASTLASLWGLNWFYQGRIQESCRARLTSAMATVRQLMRTQSFELIQRVNAAAAAPEWGQALAALPDMKNITEERQKEALEQLGAKISQPAEKTRAAVDGAQLLLVGADAQVLLGDTAGVMVGRSLKGLPAIEECLLGFARDGIYDLGGGLVQLAVSTVAGPNGKPVGCLVAARVIDAAWLRRAVQPLELDAALAVKGKFTANTIDEKDLAPLLSDSSSGKEVVYLGKLKKSPLFFGIKQAWAASLAPLAGAPEGTQLALVQPLEPLVTPLLHAQKMLWLGGGVLLIVGLLVGIIISFSRTESQLARLRAAVRLAAEGGSISLEGEDYTGQVGDLVKNISKLLEGKGRPLFGVSNGSQPRPLPAAAATAPSPEASPAAAASPSAIDFESLMKAASPSPPTTAPSPQEPPVAAAAHEPASVSPVREQQIPPARVSEPPGGPRVDLPTDLAAMFGEETKEAAPFVSHRPAVPPATSPKPAAVLPPPPVQPLSQPPGLEGDGLQLPQLVDGDEDAVPRSDATVIAQVPDQLISLTKSASAPGKVERRATVSEIPPPPSTLPRPPVPIQRATSQPPADPEEAHFHEVYERFLQTKKQCGENISDVDYERFSDKLRRNTAELKARFQCRSVRFQVYVKNGKAAIKATPIK